MLPDAEEGYTLLVGVTNSKAGGGAGGAPQLGDLTAQAPWPTSCWAELHDGSSGLHWGRQVSGMQAGSRGIVSIPASG